MLTLHIFIRIVESFFGTGVTKVREAIKRVIKMKDLIIQEN